MDDAGILLRQVLEKTLEKAEAERDEARVALVAATNAAEAPAEAVGSMAGELSALFAERERLRALDGVVRVMFDNIVATDDDAIIGFPVSDYNAIETALDALDELTGRHGNE